MTLRVLLFVDNLDRGGTQTHTVTLANALARDPDFEVHVGCIRGDGASRADLAIPSERVREYRFHRFYSPGGIVQMVRLNRYVVTAGIDIVHAMDFYANILCTAAAAWLPRVKLVVSRRYERLSDRRIHEWGERAAYRAADVVTFNSRSIADAITRRGWVRGDKVVVIPTSVDLAGDGLADGAAPSSPGGGVRLGVVARFDRDKGLDTLLDATQLLLPQWPGIEVVLVGDGELRDELVRRIRTLGLEGHVRLTGMQQDVRDWISTFTVAVLPSRREGLPRALLEYFAAGRPVVATNVGGIPDVATHGRDALLVPPDDAPALAAALDMLLRDEPRRRTLGHAARERARDFSLDHMVDATAALYRRLAPQTGASVEPVGPSWGDASGVRPLR